MARPGKPRGGPKMSPRKTYLWRLAKIFGVREAIAEQLASIQLHSSIRVNTLSPGGVFDDPDPEFLENYAARVPMARLADKKEYNGAIVFLLSDASSYMTGSNLVIDGGMTAW